ncbi:E3 ubiquitin-protein ligase MIB2-like isoform X2 [Littorina saxatilis]|uniref:E3 ubiquitin-protein ligase MIB2-like isoform X2 n=1 Tax=Littorina saxatilis TaxID=31220 RepID=UPI0038B46FCB
MSAHKPHIKGVRVLRGPHWEDGDTDGGEGHLGTVQALLSNGLVQVLWDIGTESTCRAGQDGKFDLRVFDTATVGVHHEGATCAECKEEGITGILWRCKDCHGYELCSLCYADDKHDIRHQFLPIDFPGTEGKLMKKRKMSVRIRAMGLFPGAKVTRGKDWKWKNQDGGPGSEGEVMELKDEPNSHKKRNLAKVRWPNGQANVYRLAFDGHVDITCTEEEAGGFYYRDHLPCLDTLNFTTLKNNEMSEKETTKAEPMAGPTLKEDTDMSSTISNRSASEHFVKPISARVVCGQTSEGATDAGREFWAAAGFSIAEDSAGPDRDDKEVTKEDDMRDKEEDNEDTKQEPARTNARIWDDPPSTVPDTNYDGAFKTKPEVTATDSNLKAEPAEATVVSRKTDTHTTNDESVEGAEAAVAQGKDTGTMKDYAATSTPAELGAAAATVPEDVSAEPFSVPASKQGEGIINEAEAIDTKGNNSANGAGDFQIGDRAVIGVPVETMKELQQDFGGFTESMSKNIGQAGVVARLHPPGTVGLRVGNAVFRCNPAALLKVHRYSTGDTVRIKDDLFNLRVWNERMGWMSCMDRTAGKVGQVTEVDSDEDLKVSFGDDTYLYSPACCDPAPGCAVQSLDEGTDSPGSFTGSFLSGSSSPGQLAGLGGGAGGGGGSLSALLAGLGGLGGLGGVSGLGGLGTILTPDESTEEGKLQAAIVQGDTVKVKEMCRANPVLMNTAHNGLPPLVVAGHQGKRKVVVALLDMGADIDITGTEEEGALGAALAAKQEDIALLLVEYGADVCHRNGLERTPLHQAVYNRLNEAAQVLIHMGADVNAQDRNGDTPLHSGIAGHNVAMVDLLLQLENIQVSTVNRKGYSPLQLACKVENAEMVGLILAKDSSNVNQLKENDVAAIHICVQDDFIEGVRLLVTNGNADINMPTTRQGLTALHMACLTANVRMVETLLELGADVNVQEHKGETPTHLAMGGTDGSDKSNTEKEEDIQNRLHISRLLIINGAFVDAVNQKGRPPTTCGLTEVQIGVAEFISEKSARHSV